MRYLSLSLLFLLIIPFVTPAFGADWYDSNWLKARSITIDGADIDTADLTNYPLYVNITSLDVGTVTQADCDDIVFTNYQNTTKFSHEIENCDGTANWIEAWVRVPTVYNANNTQFFMYYDNAGATDQQNTQGTWNANYKAVWHLNGTFIDSTASPITCTNSGSSAVTDEYVGDSRSFDKIDDYLNCGSDTKTDNIFDGGGTISAWVKAFSTGELNFGIIMNKLQPGNNGWYLDTQPLATLPAPLAFGIHSATTTPFWKTNSNWLPSNEWIHVAVTFNDDVSTNNPLIYANGTSRAITQTNADTAWVSDASESVCIGNWNVGDTTCNTNITWDGYIDEIRFYDAIATAEWIKADWECQRGAVDGNSCITVGAEGAEPAAGGSHSQTYADTLAITDTLIFTGTGEQVYSDTLAITDTLVFTGEGSQSYADTLAITDDLVFIYNDLNPDFTETLDLTDTYTQLCTGTCGVTPPTPTPNAIILSVNKSPFIFGVYSDATRMTCEISISGGVIWNSDDLNLNICNSTQWILPDGTGT